MLILLSGLSRADFRLIFWLAEGDVPASAVEGGAYSWRSGRALLGDMLHSAHKDSPWNPAGLVFPKAGMPLRVIQFEEITQRLQDGSAATRSRRRIVYRDAAGRTRSETQPGEPDYADITILDPNAGYLIVLDSVNRVAVQAPVPGSGQDRFGVLLPGVGGLGAQGSWRTEQASMGRRVLLAGIQFEGIRVTMVSGQQPPLRVLYEHWASSDSGLVALARASGPGVESLARIDQIDLNVPDPSLFVVPLDYTVQRWDPA